MSTAPKTPRQPSKAPRRPSATHVPDGAVFLVRLDPLECAKKVLIPGHRFEPFHALRISIPSLELRYAKPIQPALNSDMPNASAAPIAPLPKKNIVLPAREVHRFFLLLDPMTLYSTLEEMCPGNIPGTNSDMTAEPNRLIRLTVFDLEPLSPGPIAPGTSIRITTINYQKGIFSAEVLTPDRLAQRDPEPWFEALDTAFEQAFAQLKFPRSNHSLLPLVYQLGGPSLYADPPAALSDYLSAGRAAQLILYSNEHLIWKKGADPDSIVLTDLDAPGTGARKPRHAPAEFTKPGSSKKKRATSIKKRLDRFLEDFEFSYDAEEVKSMMLDMAYCGKTLQDLWNRFFAECPQWIMFADAAELPNVLGELLEEYCIEVLKTYDPASDPFGDMRTAAIDLYADYIAWLRRLDARLRAPEDLPLEQFRELAGLIGSLNELMFLMNTPERGGLDDPEEFFDTLASLRRAAKALEREIESLALRKRYR